jgi:hypothetical protein
MHVSLVSASVPAQDRLGLPSQASTGRGLAYSAKGRIFDNMLHMRYEHLIKAKPISERQTHPLTREDIT